MSCSFCKENTQAWPELAQVTHVYAMTHLIFYRLYKERCVLRYRRVGIRLVSHVHLGEEAIWNMVRKHTNHFPCQFWYKPVRSHRDQWERFPGLLIALVTGGEVGRVVVTYKMGSRDMRDCRSLGFEHDLYLKTSLWVTKHIKRNKKFLKFRSSNKMQLCLPAH